MSEPLTEESGPSRILWYGDGGTGKTTSMCAMAKGGRIWVADPEYGLKARALKSHGIPVGNIEVWPGQGNPVTWESWEAEWLQIRDDLHKDPKSWYGVCVDAITELQQKFAGQVGQAAVHKAAGRGIQRNPSVMDEDNWRETNWYTTEVLRRFRDLPCHLGITAAPRRQQDPGGRVKYMPSVTPGVQGALVGLVDTICWTEVVDIDGEEEFRGKFEATGLIQGKDRLRALPKGIVDPMFDRIQAYIDLELTVDDDPLMVAARERRAEIAARAGAEAEATAAAA